MAKDGILEIREVDIVRTDKNFAYAAAGFEDKTTIVTSSLDTVTNGMRVRVEQQIQPEQTKEDAENGG